MASMALVDPLGSDRHGKARRTVLVAAAVRRPAAHCPDAGTCSGWAGPASTGSSWACGAARLPFLTALAIPTATAPTAIRGSATIITARVNIVEIGSLAPAGRESI